MLNNVKLIAAVKATFFNDDENAEKQQTKTEQQQWQRLAQILNISSTNAQQRWQQICDDYLHYLRRGDAEFRFAAEMQFMQAILMQQRRHDHSSLLDQSQSDLDLELDECELQRILNSDEEDEAAAVLPTKRARTTTPPLSPTPPPQSPEKVKSTCLPSEPAAPPATDVNISGNSIHSLSSLELIFLGYAKVLQKLPRPLMLATKRKIADIMDDAEMQLLDEGHA